MWQHATSGLSLGPGSLDSQGSWSCLPRWQQKPNGRTAVAGEVGSAGQRQEPQPAAQETMAAGVTGSVAGRRCARADEAAAGCCCSALQAMRCPRSTARSTTGERRWRFFVCIFCLCAAQDLPQGPLLVRPFDSSWVAVLAALTVCRFAGRIARRVPTTAATHSACTICRSFLGFTCTACLPSILTCCYFFTVFLSQRVCRHPLQDCARALRQGPPQPRAAPPPRLRRPPRAVSEWLLLNVGLHWPASPCWHWRGMLHVACNRRRFFFVLLMYMH